MFEPVKEIYSRRSLVKALVVRNLKVRYSRPLLGIVWAFLTPFLAACIYYVVFSVILKVKIAEAPFFIYLMSAVFTWGFFQSSVTCAATSLVDNKNLIKESSFPHYLVPVAIVLENVVNFLPALLVLIAASFFSLKGLPRLIVFFPVVFALHIAITIGLSVICSVLYVRWRDLKYVLDAALLLAANLTPVFYSIHFVKGSFTDIFYKLYLCNPFVGILNFYRCMFFKGFYADMRTDITAGYLLIPAFIFAALILPMGFYLYKKNKDTINDHISY